MEQDAKPNHHGKDVKKFYIQFTEISVKASVKLVWKVKSRLHTSKCQMSQSFFQGAILRKQQTSNQTSWHDIHKNINVEETFMHNEKH